MRLENFVETGEIFEEIPYAPQLTEYLKKWGRLTAEKNYHGFYPVSIGEAQKLIADKEVPIGQKEGMLREFHQSIEYGASIDGHQIARHQLTLNLFGRPKHMEFGFNWDGCDLLGLPLVPRPILKACADNPRPEINAEIVHIEPFGLLVFFDVQRLDPYLNIPFP